MLINEEFQIYDYIRYICCWHNYLKLFIRFDKKMHTVSVEGIDKDNYTITLFLDAAIKQKCKELGW